MSTYEPTAHAAEMADLESLINPSAAPKHRDNADPHAVILTVHPREWVIPYAHEREAEYEIEVEHPVTCSGCVEDCPVADYLEVVGIDETFHAGFPGQDDLTDDELAVLDGTVRFITMTRTWTSWSNPNGTEYDVDYDTAWHDDEAPVPTEKECSTHD